MSSILQPATSAKDKVLGEAIEIAREALLDIAKPDLIGDHAGVVTEGERLLTHVFTCLRPGYAGWFWTCTVTRASRSKKVTINELSLKPGPDALLAPEWVPWAERLEPGDVSGTDRLPYKKDDDRLMGGFEDAGEDADQLETYEIGMGRARVLSEKGRSEAFNRWYASDRGPKNQATRAAKATCSSCGFLMLMAGSARTMFGVCANEWSPEDGKVVSLDHGCGAHSETDVPKQKSLWVQTDPVIDDSDDLDVEQTTKETGTETGTESK